MVHSHPQGEFYPTETEGAWRFDRYEANSLDYAIGNHTKPDFLAEHPVYPTPNGERILLGGERRLFEESLGMMVDYLSDGDFGFGVPAFDELQLGQKLFALYRAGRALLEPDEPPPERTAFLEAALATVYKHVLDMVEQEIDDPDFASRRPSWRQLVIEAACDSDNIDEVPKETSRNKEDWVIVVDCLADDVLVDGH